MRLAILSFLAGSASLVSTRLLEKHDVKQIPISDPTMQHDSRFLLEFANGTTQWTTEAEKQHIMKDGEFFMDITNYRELENFRSQTNRNVQFPKATQLEKEIKPLLHKINKTYIQSHLEYFTTFHNRWYDSIYGEASYHWLLSTIMTTIASTGADKYGIKAEPFIHPWGQNSIIVTIPGKTSSTVVVGAHQDSVNLTDPVNGRAPGADDDGSGSVTILEVLRVILTSKDLLEGKAENTIEFHWYSGEEGGLLGSQAVFLEYARQQRDVKAMLQQDMTGFYNATISKRKEFGLLLDFYDKPLMEYIKLIIDEYTDIAWVETICGHCGSDHMSAIKAGYPAIYVIEGDFSKVDNHLHGDDDLIKYLDFDHMIDHAQMTLGFLYELAFAKL